MYVIFKLFMKSSIVISMSNEAGKETVGTTVVNFLKCFQLRF